MRLGIDIDETIVNTHEVALNYSKKIALKFKHYEDLYCPEGIKFLTNYIEKIQRNVRLLPDVKESLKILKEKNFKLIFITARGSNHDFNFTYNHKGITEEMFNKYNIPYDKIIYECYPKGKKAFEEKIDYFIDDNEENLDDIAKYGIKCIKKVTNMGIPSKHIKFDNWQDILNYLLKEIGEK